MQEIQIHYHTGPYLSAPHAYQAEIICKPLADGVAMEIRQTYIDREHLDEKDIVSEGFTTEDDFAWQGKLPMVWLRNLEHRVGHLQLAEQPSEQLYLEIVSNEETKGGAPLDEAIWITFTEQLIQACLEAGEKELPMELVLGRLEKNNFYEKGRLVWSFANRKLTGQILNGKTKSFSEEDWISSQTALRKWIETEAQQVDLYQVPSFKGLFWLLNGEVWLPYGGGAGIPPLHWIEDELGM